MAKGFTGRLIILAFGTLASAALVQAQPRERSGEEVVKAQCATCHESGLHGAPKIDDRAAWAPRMKLGVDATVRSAMKGHGAMPARGGMADLSDTELRAAILYMFYPAAASMKATAAAAPTARDPKHRSVDGMEIYLGVAPAPSKGSYHVNISLRDAATKVEIRDAVVEARVASPLGGTTKRLAPTTINNFVSYGNDFRMTGNEPYTIAVQVRRPGSARPTEIRFDFKP